jgi:hypothetical protein
MWTNLDINPPYYGLFSLYGFSCSVFTDATMTKFHPDYIAIMTEQIGLLNTRLAAQGLTKGFMHMGVEEFSWTDPATVLAWETFGRILKTIDQRTFLRGSGTCPAPKWRDHDIFYQVNVVLPFFRDDMKWMQRNSKSGAYLNNFCYVSTPPIKYRLLHWALWMEGFKGHHWWTLVGTYDLGDNNPWNGVDLGMNFFYPPRGTPYETTGPVGCTRWEAVAQGTMDVELFIKLQGLIGSKAHLASAPDLATAQTALNRVAEMVTHVPIDTYSVRDTFCNYDPTTLDSIRSDVIDAIVLLEGYTTAHPQTGGVGLR